MGREAFMPLFFGDFLASTAEWEGEERALYLLLLGYQWSLGSLPADPRKLCKLIGWDQALFTRCWKTVEQKFERNGDRLTNRRLEDHRAHANEISAIRSAAGKRGAEARYGKRLLANAIANANGSIAGAAAIANGTAANAMANAGNLPSHPSNPYLSKSHSLSPDLNSVGASARASDAEAPRALALRPRKDEPIEERIRKARIALIELPTLDTSTVERMFRLSTADVLSIKAELAQQQTTQEPQACSA